MDALLTHCTCTFLVEVLCSFGFTLHSSTVVIVAWQFVQKDPLLDKFGNPILTVADSSNPWWGLFEKAILDAGGKVEKPEILLGSTDVSFFRQRGLPAIGFSAITNTPDRVHDHNEVPHTYAL